MTPKIFQPAFLMKIIGIFCISFSAIAFNQGLFLQSLVLLLVGGLTFWAYDWLNFDDLREAIKETKQTSRGKK